MLFRSLRTGEQSSVAHTSCFWRCMRAVRTHGKLRHMCATQGIGTRLNKVIPRLCTESAFWLGAGCIKFYAPKFGRYFLSARSRENRHWIKLFGNLETDSGRLSTHFCPVPPRGLCLGRRQLKRTKDAKTGQGQAKTLAVSGAARFEV